MIDKNQTTAKDIEKVLNDKISYKKGNLFHVVNNILKKSGVIKKLTHKNKTPFYIYDQHALDDSIDIFLKVFKREIPSFKAYMLLKLTIIHLLFNVQSIREWGLMSEALVK